MSELMLICPDCGYSMSTARKHTVDECENLQKGGGKESYE